MKRFFKTHLVFFFIVLCAFFLRIFNISILTSFQGDQGRDLMNVLVMIVNHKPTLLGSPSTFGPFQGPLYYYLLVPGLLLSNLEPIGGLITTVIFNIFGLIFLYIAIFKLFSKKVAVIVCWLYAISPLNIEIGRTLLNAYAGLPFFTGSMLLIISLFKSKKNYYIPLLGFIAGSLVQLHYNYAPFFLFCLLLPFFESSIAKKHFYPQFLGFFSIATLPQIIFELRHEFLNTGLLLNSFKTGHAMGQFSFSYITFFFSTVGYIVGIQHAWYGLGVFLLCAVGFGVIWKKLSLFQRKILGIFFGYMCFFLIIAVLSKVKIVYPAYHYYMTLLPLFFVFVGTVISFLPQKIMYVILIGITFVSLYTADLFRNHGFTMVDFWHLSQQQVIAKNIANDLPIDKKWNIASVVDGDTQALPFRYLIAVEGYKKYGINYPKPLRAEEYPASDIVYLVTRDTASRVFDYTVWEVASIKPFTITKQWYIEKDLNIFRIEKMVNQ